MKNKPSIKSILVALYEKLTKKSPKVLNTDEKISVNVYKLDDKAELVHTALGISQKRLDEIAKIVDKSIADQEGKACTVTALEIMSKQFNHPNELAMGTMLLMKRIERLTQPSGIGDMIQHMIDDMRKRRE